MATNLNRVGALSRTVPAVSIKVCVVGRDTGSALIVFHSRIGHTVTSHTVIPRAVTLRPALPAFIVSVPAIALPSAVHTVRRKVRPIAGNTESAEIKLHSRISHIVASHALIPRLRALCNALAAPILLQRRIASAIAVHTKVVKPRLSLYSANMQHATEPWCDA